MTIRTALVPLTPTKLVNASVKCKLEEYSMPEPMSGCTIWLRATYKGYGTMWHNNANHLAHRMSWELEKGPVPEGLVLDHICRNRCCINPQHLRAVTNQQNILLGVGYSAQNNRKTRCPKGHEYDGRKADGTRICSLCRREYARQFYHRTKSRRIAA